MKGTEGLSQGKNVKYLPVCFSDTYSSYVVSIITVLPCCLIHLDLTCDLEFNYMAFPK